MTAATQLRFDQLTRPRPKAKCKVGQTVWLLQPFVSEGVISSVGEFAGQPLYHVGQHDLAEWEVFPQTEAGRERLRKRIMGAIASLQCQLAHLDELELSGRDE